MRWLHTHIFSCFIRIVWLILLLFSYFAKLVEIKCFLGILTYYVEQIEHFMEHAES